MNHPPKKISQLGFTLLELMVALVIFAVMSMLGWQIMDSLTKSRDRAKAKIATVRALQYAYETLAQDLAQTSNYVAFPPTATGMSLANINITPSFMLNNQGVIFTRLAPPDPRLAVSPTLARVGYSVTDNKLIKSQFATLLPNRGDNPMTNVLLNDISEVKWTALTPNPVTVFPDGTTLQKSINPTVSALPNPPATPDISAYQQLPKGIELQFTYQQMPIIWRFALPSGSPNMGLNQNVTNGIEGK